MTDIGDFELPFDLDEYGIPAVYPPSDFTCELTPEGYVQMSWTNPEDYDAVNLYRDEALIATLPGNSTSYLDMAPGYGLHVYAVTGVVGGDESSPAECEVIVYPDWEGVCFDFNDWDGGGIFEGYADWEWGYPSYVIDGNAWETNLDGNYFNNACGRLTSPLINLGPEGGWLTFDSWNYVECAWDGWNFQISTDGGVEWEMLTPLEGYDQGFPYGGCPDHGLNGDTNCGYGELEHWNVDLTGFPNTSIRIRFWLGSDSSVAYTGVVLDNVCVLGGSVPAVQVECELLNPDEDGDGVRDVHIGEYLYYRATFVSMTEGPVEYGVQHLREHDRRACGVWRPAPLLCTGKLSRSRDTSHRDRPCVQGDTGGRRHGYEVLQGEGAQQG